MTWSPICDDRIVARLYRPCRDGHHNSSGIVPPQRAPIIIRMDDWRGAASVRGVLLSGKILRILGDGEDIDTVDFASRFVRDERCLRRNRNNDRKNERRESKSRNDLDAHLNFSRSDLPVKSPPSNRTLVGIRIVRMSPDWVFGIAGIGAGRARCIPNFNPKTSTFQYDAREHWARPCADGRRKRRPRARAAQDHKRVNVEVDHFRVRMRSPGPETGAGNCCQKLTAWAGNARMSRGGP